MNGFNFYNFNKHAYKVILKYNSIIYLLPYLQNLLFMYILEASELLWITDIFHLLSNAEFLLALLILELWRFLL
jgi:hypothetical protein